MCHLTWNPVINHHIHNQTKCPRCNHRLPWTLETFLEAAHKLHGDKYNYSLIKDTDIDGARRYININCNICQQHWTTTLGHHINNKTGCPQCSGRALLTYERFINSATKIHGNDCDFSYISESDVKNCNSRAKIICNICYMEWHPQIRIILYNKSGCPNCKASKGERECMRVLESINIKFEREIKINALPTRFYDFKFNHNGIGWILEYDGIQHFEFVSLYHNCDIEKFYEHQRIDKLKTEMAIREGYYVIHIDYTQFSNIQYHINQALDLKQSLYLSTPELYSHLN